MTVFVGPRPVANGTRPLLIAEAGVNHNGQLNLALALVDAAAEAGADAVKFQSFRADALAVRDAPTPQYQRERGGMQDQHAMLAALELGIEALREVASRAREHGLLFLSTPFDVRSLAELVDLGVPAIKIGSGDLTNLPLLRSAAATGLPLLLSTGMATLGEVETVLAAIPSESIVLLHCTSAYPAPMEDANLRAIETLRARFGHPVGYSDHTKGITASVAATTLGAAVIEKHFTISRRLPGPDHAASLEPAELKELVAAVHDVGLTLGDGVKAPRPAEEELRSIARRSLVAARDLPAGHRLRPEDIDAKRPGVGISPLEIDRVVGCILRSPIVGDQLLTQDLLQPPDESLR